MKKLLCIFLALVMVFALAACAGDTQKETPNSENPSNSENTDKTEGNPDSAGDKIKIGLAAKGFTDPFTAMEANMYISVAKERFGDQVELTALDCEFDTAKQCEVLENFISMGMDAIICQVADPEAILPYVQKCQEEGIYFICDLDIDSDWAYEITSDPTQDGEMLGQYAVDWFAANNVKDPVILFMQGEVGNWHANSRENGCKDVLAKNGYEVTATNSANWARDEALELMENWCQLYDHIDAVICANDDMGLGVVQVLKAENRLDGTLVISVDALAEAVQSVMNGELTMTVGKNIDEGCTTAIQLAVDLVSGVDRSADKELLVSKDIIAAENTEIVEKWAALHGIK